MLNAIWAGLIGISILTAALTGNMEAVTNASVDSAKDAVTLALSLIGIMAFWLGLMKIADDGGLLRILARKIKPVMARLFPDVPAEHPAMSAMIMNLSANMLGLGNAATPFGLKAMQELDRLNPRKGVATDAMCLFLAMNATNVSIFPLGVIAVRAALGSKDPAGIFATTLIATSCSTVTAVIAAKILQRLPRYRKQLLGMAQTPSPDTEAAEEEITVESDRQPWRRMVALVLTAVFFALMAAYFAAGVVVDGFGPALRNLLGTWLIPTLIGAILVFGFGRGVKVYESAVEGAKEGFQVAIRIIPFLVAILVAVAMFRASGALGFLIQVLDPATRLIGMPGEALPMALLRPLSGSGAYAIMAEIMKTHGPDSFIGYLVSTLQGSTETTFYVLAIYFGAVQVKVVRQALPACLIGDVAGILAAVWVCHLFF